MSWLLWALLLVLQNASFTWVSRARNSGDLGYHALAAICSNGIYIVAMVFMIDKLRNPEHFLPVAALYTSCTVTGSVLTHWFSMRYLEKG